MVYDITIKYKPEFLRGSVELEELLQGAQQAGLDLRTQAQFKRPDYPDLFKKNRKDIARIKTILCERNR